jgi:tRNA (cmo5U34)-methyltransferase
MTWQFNATVASNFGVHARQHIPNYDQVIDQCIDICNTYPKSAKIVDIGCAIGETINRLNGCGFTNLYGIDNSEDMLSYCNPAYATYICSDTMPSLQPVDVALMNWTLHFIKDKQAYLTDIFNQLSDNGTLVLTDKVSLDPYLIDLYHTFKKNQGVSNAEVEAKAKSVENIMFINSTQWYLDLLSCIGFKKIFIINASWCFNTFVCLK